MSIKESGSLAFSEIAAEFDQSTPYSLSDYYRNGDIVPDATDNAGIPESGAISIGDFYGATKRIQITKTVSANTADGIDLKAYADANGYQAGITDIYLVVDNGIYVGSPSDEESYAVTADGFATGDIVHITNNGYILGAGGTGGNGGECCGSVAFDGNDGGRGIYTTIATNITNNGTIAGGGGGGGGAGCLKSHSGTQKAVGGSGGGGGAGYLGGTGGSESGGFCSRSPALQDGATGTQTTGGAGGQGATATCSESGSSTVAAAGNGGDLGQAGTQGGTSTPLYYDWVGQTGGAGGAAGYYLVGNSNVTWVTEGTRLGQVS